MSGRMLTRRDFLRTGGTAVIAVAAGAPLLAGEGKTATVVLIRDANVLDGRGHVDRAVISRMLDDAVAKLFGVGDSGQAWKQIVSSRDVVGIKSNVWSYLRTPPELEQALAERVSKAGVGPDRIGFDDRGVLSNPLFRRSTVLINTRPMRAHHWSGVGGCLKNYIMFVPHPAEYHGGSCRDLGAIWKLPVVEGKTRLNILVMLTPQFHCRGPHHFNREYTWAYRGLLVGTDPVALDAVGLKILEAKRELYFREPSPIHAAWRHITAAEERHGVGVADLARIRVVRLGWDQDILI